MKIINFLQWLVFPDKMALQLVDQPKDDFLNRCPATGGTCLNPFCAFGCIEE